MARCQRCRRSHRSSPTSSQKPPAITNWAPRSTRCFGPRAISRSRNCSPAPRPEGTQSGNHARTERGTSGLNRHWREIVRAQPVTTPDAATAGSADTHAAWHKQRQQARHPCTNIAATSAMNHSGLPPLPSPLLSDRGRRQRSTPTAPEVGQLAALVRMARYFPDRASDSHRPSIRLLHSVFRVHQMLQRP